MPAWQSSTYTYRSDTGAERAVDGQYTDLGWNSGQCAVSQNFQLTVEWRVDLGGVKTIHHVRIHHVGKSILGIIYLKIINWYLK